MATPITGWMKAANVKSLTVSEKPLEYSYRGRRKTASGAMGTVFPGRIVFDNGVRKRVAVKVFHEPPSERRIARYHEVLEELEAAGVRLPKTGFVKHQGAWVQVMPLYGGSSRGSKFVSKLSPQELNAALPKIAKYFAELTSKNIFPHNDHVQFMREKAGVHLMPIDFDTFTYNPNEELQRLWGVGDREFPRELIYRSAQSLVRAPFMHANRRKQAVDAFFASLPQSPHAARARERIMAELE